MTDHDSPASPDEAPALAAAKLTIKLDQAELAGDPAKPTLWGEREPTDRSYPVPHYDARVMPGLEGWRIVGVSRRGKLHAHEGKYREDAWDAALSAGQQWQIVAVADGGGAYPLARVGAQCVVESVVRTLVRTLPTHAFMPDTITDVLAGALDQAYLDLDERALTIARERPGTTTRDLSTTLLVIAHCPSEQLVCVAQVGDGLIALQKGNQELVKLAEADSGAVAGTTVFLNNVTKRDWRRRIKQYKLIETPLFITALTDGVADDVLETPNNFPILFRALSEYTRRKQSEVDLLAWLDYEKRGSFDDRTLVVIYQP